MNAKNHTHLENLPLELKDVGNYLNKIDKSKLF